jgi:flagellin-like protein
MRCVIDTEVDVNMKEAVPNKGISPVIGVILMVAITVILAGVIGTNLLGLQDRLEEPGAVAGITADAEVSEGYFAGGNYKVVLTHVAGDKLDSEDTRLIVRSSAGTARVDFADFPDEAKQFRESSSKIEEVTGPGGSYPGDKVIYTFSGNKMPAEFRPGDSIEVVVLKSAVGGEEVEVVLVDTEEKKVMSKSEIPSGEFP